MNKIQFFYVQGEPGAPGENGTPGQAVSINFIIINQNVKALQAVTS